MEETDMLESKACREKDGENGISLEIGRGWRRAEEQ
jgi:hypothetical protein